MVSYHINPETGRANICRATVRDCKYSVDGVAARHFSSKEEAQEFSKNLDAKTFGDTFTASRKSSLVVKSFNDFLWNQEENDRRIKELHGEFLRIEANSSREEMNTVSQYAMALSTEVNRYLHGEPLKYHTTEEDMNYLKRSVANLDRVIARNETNADNRKLFRFLVVPEGVSERSFFDEIVANGSYSDSGFMSTTEDLSYIAAAAHKYRKKFVVLALETSRGISLQQNDREQVGNVQSFEKERLLPRNMKFDVVDSSVASLKIHDSREDLRKQFAGSRMEDWKTGLSVANEIRAKKFLIASMVESSN